jgi:hypothetical protein
MRPESDLTGSVARVRPLATCLLILVILAASIAAAAQPANGRAAQPANEAAAKAAFLYNLAGFVDWPPGTFRDEEPLQIGVMGDEGVARELEQLVTGRSFEGRPIAVRRLREVDETTGLHMLLVGPLGDARLREISASTPGAVLLVSEQENGLRFGAVLNFVPNGGRVRFSASIAAAEARGLRLSARLLALAESVEGRPR